MSSTKAISDWILGDGCPSGFEWFLIDEGKIWYAFQSREDALLFQKDHLMSGMLLLNADSVPDVLMADPEDIFCWRSKTPVHARRGRRE